MLRPTLDQLATFVSIVEQGSFSAAAERHHLTQPAVSRQIKELERHYRQQLVERIGRRAMPTTAGLRLLPLARDLLSRRTAMDEAMASQSTGALGRVRIATGATASIHLLPPVLRRLRQAHPTLELIVTTGNTPVVLKAVEENQVDLALVTMPAPGRSFLVQPILTDEFVAIAARDAPALPQRVTPAVMARRPMVLYESGAHTRQIIDRWLRRGGVTVKPAMELGGVEAIKELVGAGLGCSILPSMAVVRSQLQVRSLTPRLQRTLALVMRRDKLITRGLRTVITALEQLAN